MARLDMPGVEDIPTKRSRPEPSTKADALYSIAHVSRAFSMRAASPCEMSPLSTQAWTKGRPITNAHGHIEQNRVHPCTMLASRVSPARKDTAALSSESPTTPLENREKTRCLCTRDLQHERGVKAFDTTRHQIRRCECTALFSRVYRRMLAETKRTESTSFCVEALRAMQQDISKATVRESTLSSRNRRSVERARRSLFSKEREIFLLNCMRVKIERAYNMPAVEGYIIKKDRAGNIILAGAQSQDRAIKGVVYIKTAAIRSVEHIPE
ncbi:uncharacterized protein NEMAJ01_1596 [Nematocida major]|uniref:uncharacterized protein n=1 Tax=Nematocida major TaxID=1912982 RepID=UPI002008C3BA|nr:uncharacterized protein NEMAJ01_1596 [Nematocida major]KAH9386700.1 hypothetical protein NEMAJ01_1596 [Nematocida major]